MSTGPDDKPAEGAAVAKAPAKKAAPRKTAGTAKKPAAAKTPAKKPAAKKAASPAKPKTAAATKASDAKVESAAAPTPDTPKAAEAPKAAAEPKAKTGAEQSGASAEPSAKDLLGDKKWEHYLKRGVFMLVFGFMAWLSISVSFLAAGIQFIILVLTGKPNDIVTKLIVTLGSYIADVMAYLSFKSDELPFPLGKKLPVEE